MYEYHLINISAYLLINNPMYDVCLTYRWDKLTETWISDLDLALGAAGPVRALINISADSFQYPSINVWCIERTTKQLNTLTGGRTVRILHVYTLLSGHGAKKQKQIKTHIPEEENSFCTWQIITELLKNLTSVYNKTARPIHAIYRPLFYQNIRERWGQVNTNLCQYLICYRRG